MSPEATPDNENGSAGAKLGDAWSERIAGPGRGARAASAAAGEEDPVDAAIGRLREEAVRAAREDASSGFPRPEGSGITDSESDLRERCKAFYERWQARERRALHDAAAEEEEKLTDKLGRAGLEIDRFERFTKELIRLKARLTTKRHEVRQELAAEKAASRPRGIPTKVYVLAIGFLGVVEFFANAPVFGSLLPRDALTEQQMRLVMETSSGWLAGAERVLAQIILRPDAALLAAGVVTFLCVLAHFFGHSLREFVMQRDVESRRETVTGRSQMENIVPMVISGLGLMLVLGVLYEARIRLGERGEQEFQDDMSVVEEFDRRALQAQMNGELLEANRLENQADDMRSAAENLREYTRAMSGLSFPILLLNATLVLCAISAAYFHRRDRRREHFNENPYEDERRALIEGAESAAREVSRLLSESVRHLRGLRTLYATDPSRDGRQIIHQLEAVVALYRAESVRARDMDPNALPGFSEGVKLGIEPPGNGSSIVSRDPAEYEREREELRQRFEKVRRHFNEEAVAW